MQIKNLTRNAIKIINKDCVQFNTEKKVYELTGAMSVIAELPKDKTYVEPRCSIFEQELFTVDGVPILSVAYDSLDTLPPRKYGVMYVISRSTAYNIRAYERSDFLTPAGIVYISDGTVVGCLGLAKVGDTTVRDTVTSMKVDFPVY